MSKKYYTYEDRMNGVEIQLSTPTPSPQKTAQISSPLSPGGGSKFIQK